MEPFEGPSSEVSDAPQQWSAHDLSTHRDPFSETDMEPFEGPSSDGPGFSIPDVGQLNLQSSPPDGVGGVRNIIGFQGQQIGKHAGKGAIRMVGKSIPGLNGIIDGVQTFKANPNKLNLGGRLLQSVAHGAVSAVTPPLLSAFDAMSGSHASNLVRDAAGRILAQSPKFKKSEE